MEHEFTLNHRVRLVTAASLFDGHDAAINVMRRLLQLRGAEVIHLGHNRSAESIVTAALQEDVQAVAVSSYQGGHIEFFKYVLELLRRNGVPHIKVFGGGGGTITPDEIIELEGAGVTKIYSPEDGRKMGLLGIIEHLLTAADSHPLAAVDWSRLGDFASTPRALSQALTCLELGEPGFAEGPFQDKVSALHTLRTKIEQQAGRGTVVGITGTGGAGKSSFTDELVIRLLERDPQARVAVLAIDPTRRKTGGALLGDRLRMNSLGSPRVFMRSLATRQANAAVSRATHDCLALLRAAGFDWIFLETSGIGQADTSIVDQADLCVYVMTPEYGAATQLEKINMLDYADIVVLNKYEKAGGLDALTEVRKQFRRNHPEFEALPAARYPVFATVASRFADPGVTRAFEHLFTLKDAPAKRVPLAVDFDAGSPWQQTIVPRSRIAYLAEIAATVRGYKQRVAEGVRQVRHIDSLENVIESSGQGAVGAELSRQRDAAREALDPEVRDVLESYNEQLPRYQADAFEQVDRVKNARASVPLFHESLSQNKIRRIALPRFASRADLVRFLMLENLPGYFPYTAGVFPLRRPEEDPKRMFAGEGPPERTNRRFHLLCDGEKAKRLSTAFDSVTLYGNDPDERPDIFGKVGESGVSICTLDDMKQLYAGFDLCDPNTSVSMTINGPAPMMLAFFFNTALDQQVERFEKAQGRAPSDSEREEIRRATFRKVRGTVQADILKEDQAQNTCIFSTEFALRMMGDIQQFFIENEVRNYYSVSISGYHIAEAGANPISQLAFTLANGFTYVEYYLARGMPIDSFAPNLSFFFSNSLDPEYAVIGRVARRIWATAMKYRYGANERSQKLKYHMQTSGRSLHAQEIAFNDIRTTLQALLGYLDQCNSLHTNAYDEAVTTPTEESVRRAMAIQLIIAKELGLSKNENPLQGSFFIDELTDLVEETVLAEFERISLRGGVLGAMETQYQRAKIQEESLHYERLKHSGELPIIGVNAYLNPHAEQALRQPAALTRATYDEKTSQIRRLREFQKRHAKEAPKALARLKEVALGGGNTFEALLDAARICSLGQMTQALFGIGGEYRRAV
ncbi:MAG: fused isobutyryl-CoA mutase/GTPase IcmF [Planctomycetaceae bacterium]